MAPDGLHLGFDRNTANNSKMFYNTSGTWSQVSVLPGSFMIRPLVGSSPLTAVNENTAERSFRCYPNPSTGSVHLSAGKDNIYKEITVTDAAGRMVFRSAYHDGTFDFSNFTPGIYNIRLSGDAVISSPLKLVISKQ